MKLYTAKDSLVGVYPNFDSMFSWTIHTHTQPLFRWPLPSLSPACQFCSSLCLSFHAMDSLCLINAPPFPCSCRCVLNACSSYRCHSGVRPGLHRSLRSVAQLETQLHQEHELWQSSLPQDHWWGWRGRDPHWADWRHGTPCTPSPIPTGCQHGSCGSRWHMPAVHCPSTWGQHARPWYSLVHGAADALHCKVTDTGNVWRRWPLMHTHIQWGQRWLGLSSLKGWTTLLHAAITAMSYANFHMKNTLYIFLCWSWIYFFSGKMLRINSRLINVSWHWRKLEFGVRLVSLFFHW